MAESIRTESEYTAINMPLKQPEQPYTKASCLGRFGTFLGENSKILTGMCCLTMIMSGLVAMSVQGSSSDVDSNSGKAVMVLGAVSCLVGLLALPAALCGDSSHTPRMGRGI